MKFRSVKLGEYQYLVDHLINGKDFNDINICGEFVILRNYDIYNNIVYDKDIYFIEKSLYEQVKDDEETDLLCYPCNKNNNIIFSKNIYYYNQYHLLNIKDLSYEIKKKKTDINGDDIEDTPRVLCDILRIYNPSIKKNLPFIIYVDNYINDIHFHYFCNLNTNFKKKYSKEIKDNMSSYIEYIDLYIPNIRYLFEKSNKFYIEENMNFIDSIEDSDTNVLDYIQGNDNDEGENELYLYSMIQPFFIKKIDEENNKKVYINDSDYNINFINDSINVLLFPYSAIIDNTYLIDNAYNCASIFLTTNKYFRLTSRIGFNDEGIISLINTFDYPNKIPDSDADIVKYYNSYYLNNLIDEYEREDISDELDFEGIRSTGFVIQIATDEYFKEVIFESIINTDAKNTAFIYDFTFNLNNIFNSWDQLQDILVCRALFIDKKLNNLVRGNSVVLTKNLFKYFINDIIPGTVYYEQQNNLIEEKFMDVKNGFNLIDKFKCVIEEDSKNNVNVYNASDANISKVIYKPIFYKVQDLQLIKIRENLTQNIGINLGDYMAKVNAFILNIDNINIRESSRNDFYVIFSVDATLISTGSGKYNILNDNFEYISSGEYLVY